MGARIVFSDSYSAVVRRHIVTTLMTEMMILHRLFSISAQIAFPQSQPLKIAKPQSRQLKIHQNSLPTATPDQLLHFFYKKTRHPSLFSERRMPQKWLKHWLFQPSFNLFLLAEPLSQHALSQLFISLYKWVVEAVGLL